MNKKEDENREVELFSSTDEYEIIQIGAILEENKIPFLKRQIGSGAYMSLYMGQSMQEKQILVSQKDYEKALELIDPFINKETEDENNLEDEIENNKQEENFENKYKKIRRWMGMLILGIPILVILIIIIISTIIK